MLRLNSILALCLFLIFGGCKKIDSLPRNNPLDLSVQGTSLQFSKYSLYGWHTDDSIPTNMSASIKIYLKNTGYNAAEGVKATFNYLNNDGEVTFYNIAANYGTIAPNTEEYGTISNVDDWSIVIKISSSAISGTTKDFSINISDAKNNVWKDTVRFIVQ